MRSSEEGEEARHGERGKEKEREIEGERIFEGVLEVLVQADSHATNAIPCECMCMCGRGG